MGPPQLAAPIDITPSDTTGRDHDATLSDDGLVMYFASTRPPSAADDVWRVVRPDRTSKFGAPEPVPTLNSAEAEGSFFTRDGTTGWLSTDRADGLGASDLWYATRSADGSYQLSAAPLAQINAPGSQYDAWVSTDGLRIYYSAQGTVYVASRTATNGVFSAITVLPGIPTSAFDVTLSPDELVIVYAEQSQAGRRGLVATRPSTTDGFGVGVPVPELASPILDPFVSHDGCELLFATDRGRQPGDHAIWYATMNP